MEETKTNQNVAKTEDKPKPLIEQLRELKEFKQRTLAGKTKKRESKIPRKAKVTKRKLKKGWIGILKIDENRNVSMEKQRVSGFAYLTKDGLYHTTDGREILFWNGRFPVVIQPSWKNNPIKLAPETEQNETYGQPYIKAKMLADTIKVKKKGGNIIIWILIGAAVLFGINYFAGGNLFG